MKLGLDERQGSYFRSTQSHGLLVFFFLFHLLEEEEYLFIILSDVGGGLDCVRPCIGLILSLGHPNSRWWTLLMAPILQRGEPERLAASLQDAQQRSGRAWL